LKTWKKTATIVIWVPACDTSSVHQMRR